ncbi:MAG: hypothetical protein KAU31_06880, partial [Spirochaetaceae bacterium]|nr:hypothetical protein [Spirochaetaceae bacterium]
MGINRRLALPLVLLMSVFVLGTGFTFETIDMSGIYETTHPREETGKVFVRFERTQSELVYDGIGYPSYKVSVWKPGDEHVQKLRDGLFGTYTTAAVCPGEHGWVFLWYSPDEDDFKFNKIIRVDSHGNLSIGSQNPSSGDNRTYNVLSHGGDRVDVDELRPENLALEGVYRYFHSATGNVYVRFEKNGDTMTVSRGVEIDAYSVTVLSKVGEFGYCPVRDGLYGGSLENDSFPLVGIHAEDDGNWLIWKNPDAPRRIRRNRIVSVYPNGDIGIGLDQGELKYVEDTVFQRVAGLDARIGEYSDFIDLEGSYTVRLGESESEVQVRISTTDIVPGDTPGEPAVYRISAVEGDSGASPTAFGGLFDGDPFSHVAIITRDGRGYFVWYSFSLQTTEENLIFDLDAEGGFLLVGGEFGERYVVAEFRKTPSSPREDECARTLAVVDTPEGSDLDAWIRAVETRSCLAIERNLNNPWTP